jgi:hypothetical protein
MEASDQQHAPAALLSVSPRFPPGRRQTCSSLDHRFGRHLLPLLLPWKSCPCASFNWAPRHEGILGEWTYSSTHSLISALHGGEWSASSPAAFTPRKRAPGTHWIGGWVGPRDGPDAAVKRKIPNPRQESNPRNPIVQLLAQRYTDWAITVL